MIQVKRCVFMHSTQLSRSLLYIIAGRGDAVVAKFEVVADSEWQRGTYGSSVRQFGTAVVCWGADGWRYADARQMEMMAVDRGMGKQKTYEVRQVRLGNMVLVRAVRYCHWIYRASRSDEDYGNIASERHEYVALIDEKRAGMPFVFENDGASQLRVREVLRRRVKAVVLRPPRIPELYQQTEVWNPQPENVHVEERCEVVQSKMIGIVAWSDVESERHNLEDPDVYGREDPDSYKRL
ncbi:hypothetical protein DFH07DRAFT_767970 [Mycena maculata]|uniref:Uncharacterized protein n=1 Tax=Mycena maculata TaxID=230809 RepID=A0AAD7NSE4_9AGAR|nr:hypothetical protein DFH07DRAFT_767970 [Mycena maculata]